MNINTLFDTLDDWRCLPAYQLERRVDVFFALHLKEILKRKLNDATIDIIIPEFPLRKGDLNNFMDNDNKSYKIDYLVFSKTRNQVYLIELKTDQKSRRYVQYDYL